MQDKILSRLRQTFSLEFYFSALALQCIFCTGDVQPSSLTHLHIVEKKVPLKTLWFLLQQCSTWELCKQKPFGECLVGAGLPRPLSSSALSWSNLWLPREFLWNSLSEISSLVLMSFWKGWTVILGLWAVFAHWWMPPHCQLKIIQKLAIADVPCNYIVIKGFQTLAW